MKNILKIALFIAAVVAVQLLYGWPELIADMKGFAETHNNPFAFFAIMSIGCAIGLPLSFCTLYAGAAFGALIIIFPEQAMSGARGALEGWQASVFPALFPFFPRLWTLPTSRANQ